MSKHEQRRTPRDGVVWTPEQRDSYRKALIKAQQRTNLRMTIAFTLVIVASVVGAVLSGHEAGKSGAKAGRAEVERAAKQYSYAFQISIIDSQRAGCERNNARIRELNQRAVQHEKTDEAIRIVAEGAKEARLRAFKDTGERFNLQAAREYDRSIELLKTIKFRKFPQVDCKLAYPTPEAP